jgi:NH3-dependent NAD+ synthetase
MTTRPETIETSQWDNRELMLRIYYQTVETNGWVRQLRHDVYGCPEMEIVGLKEIAQENSAYRERMKVGLRIGFAVAGTLGTILTAILVLIIEHVI